MGLAITALLLTTAVVTVITLTLIWRRENRDWRDAHHGHTPHYGAHHVGHTQH
jgi:hypothetical protein